MIETLASFATKLNFEDGPLRIRFETRYYLAEKCARLIFLRFSKSFSGEYTVTRPGKMLRISSGLNNWSKGLKGASISGFTTTASVSSVIKSGRIEKASHVNVTKAWS